MQKHPRSLLALALACSVSACQPGSTPVQNRLPLNSSEQIQHNLDSIPTPRQKTIQEAFDIQSTSSCYSTYEEDLSCYLSGGFAYTYTTCDGVCVFHCEYDSTAGSLSPDCGEDDDDDNQNKCNGICKVTGGGKDGLLSLELSTDYFSPNGDGVKDSVNIIIEDPEGEGWTLEVSGGGGVIGSGTGNSTLTWDGGGQPEGKYNVVLKAKGKNIKLPLVLDVTPPVITYNQVNQPNGRSVFQVNIEDNLSGLDPDNTGVDLQGLEVTTLQEKINKRTANFKYQILPQPEPEAEPQGFQTQSLMPFSILQTLEDYDTGQAAINAADPAGNSSFMLAQVQVPKYKPSGQPGGDYQEKCKSRTTDPNSKPNQLRLAKVYDFDTGGPNLTFVIRFNTENPPALNVHTDPVLVLNAQELGLPSLQNANLRIVGSLEGLTMGKIEKMLHDPNYDNQNQPDGPNNFGDKGSLRLLPNGVKLATNKVYSAQGLIPQFPKLNQIVTELGPRANKEKHAELGYIITSIRMHDLYRTTYGTGKKAKLSLRHGSHIIDVQAHFDKNQNRWVIGCAN